MRITLRASILIHNASGLVCFTSAFHQSYISLIEPVRLHASGQALTNQRGHCKMMGLLFWAVAFAESSCKAIEKDAHLYVIFGIFRPCFFLQKKCRKVTISLLQHISPYDELLVCAVCTNLYLTLHSRESNLAYGPRFP